MRTGRALLGVGATALMVLLATGAPALAHNRLTGSDPADGATLEELPERVRLDFLASLDPSTTELTVTGPGGEPVDPGEPVFDGSRVDIPLPDVPAGDYRVAYQVLSSDGDVVEGAVEFSVSGEPSPSPPASSAPPPAPDPSVPAGPGSPPAPAAVPAAGEDGSTGWLPWLLAGLGLAAAGGALAGYRYRYRRHRSTA